MADRHTYRPAHRLGLDGGLGPTAGCAHPDPSRSSGICGYGPDHPSHVEPRTCTRCGEARPLVQFGRDSRRPDGLRSECKPCLRALQADRRANARKGRRPGALVLAPKFPDPPASVEQQPAAPSGSGADLLRHGAGLVLGGDALRARTRPASPGTYADEAERFVAALDPPAGDADALLVRSLRGLAELLDTAEHGAGEWVVRDTAALIAKLIAVQRELAATRAAKAKPAAAPAPAAPRASRY